MDLYNLVVSAKLSKGGGGGDIDVDELSVTENGTYTAEEGHAYSPVTVDVPNSYAASDEGKVVSNGALVGQTSVTKTANGTYDTTLNNEVVVNVPSVTPTGNINITSTAQTDVSAYATAQVVDADLVASNIKKDVDILGVVGTYEGGGGGSEWETLAKAFLANNQVAYPTMVVPEGITALGSRAFDPQNVYTLDLPSTITSIAHRCFQNTSLMRTLIVRAVNPPTLGTNAFNSCGATEILVPAESVEAYKEASNWEAKASIIKAIPE